MRLNVLHNVNNIYSLRYIRVNTRTIYTCNAQSPSVLVHIKRKKYERNDHRRERSRLSHFCLSGIRPLNMYKFIPVVLLISFLLDLCDEKINPPPGGNTIISSQGSQVTISWSFDNPIYRVIFRIWSFHRYGDETEDLALIHADKSPIIMNSSLPGIEVVKPATLVLKNVDLRYNGTYQFTVVGVASGSNSYVNLFGVGLDED